MILTPVKDAADLAAVYMKNLESLTYPHNLISIGILESDSRDNSSQVYQELILKLSVHFRRASYWNKDFGYRIPKKFPRWDETIQAQRRSILALSRNHLLFHALDDEDWVLWLDADVIEYPPDIIEQLLSYGKDILQPHCVLEYKGSTFDKNGWRDQGKYHLDLLREEGDLVRLDTVGGTMLLVRADIHRNGLIFPSYYYGNKSPLIRQSKKSPINSKPGEIETEGLGIMADDMGVQCWGLPHLEIKHRNK